MFVHIRSRLMFLFSLAVLLAVGVYSVSLFYLYRQDIYSDLDKSLRSDIEVAEMALEKHLLELPVGSELVGDSIHIVADPSNWLTEIWDLKGKRHFASGASDLFPLGTDLNCLKQIEPQAPFSLSSVNARVQCLKSEAYPDQYLIRVARLTDRAMAQLNKFILFMTLGIPSVVAISALAGYFLARRALSPITDIVEKAKRISIENLSERIRVNHPRDEIGELGATFNQMFERLEKSFEQVRSFTADASHELRTPLSAIRTIGEVALRGDLGSDSYREVVGQMLEETSRLQNLCERLLTLSKAEGAGLELKLEETKLRDFCREIFDLIAVLAEEKGISMTLFVEEEVSVRIDPFWFRQALLNILDNAIKYAPVSGHIEIRSEEIGRMIELKVKDDGAGISKENLEKIFERFYRPESGRDRKVGGAGLGLAIAKSIVTAHAGTISIESQSGQGTEVTVSLIAM